MMRIGQWAAALSLVMLGAMPTQAGCFSRGYSGGHGCGSYSSHGCGSYSGGHGGCYASSSGWQGSNYGSSYGWQGGCNSGCSVSYYQGAHYGGCQAGHVGGVPSGFHGTDPVAPGGTSSAPHTQPAAPPPGSARMTIRVPAEATLFLQDQQMRTTGSVREFFSPPLQQGLTYTYQIRVEVQEHGRLIVKTAQAQAIAGGHVEVAFSLAAGGNELLTSAGDVQRP